MLGSGLVRISELRREGAVLWTGLDEDAIRELSPGLRRIIWCLAR